MLWAAAGLVWSSLSWLLGWFWWLTVKPSLYVLGAGAAWHLAQRWFYRLLARQLAGPSGWFGKNVAPTLLRDLNSACVRWALPRIPIADEKSCKSVLDVGCGGSLAFEPFWERFKDPSTCVLEGIDSSSEAIEHCSEVVAGRPRVNLTLGSVLQLPWDANHFDMVCAFNILDILAADQEKRALDEMIRCLRPGGTLAVTTKEPSSYLRAPETQAGIQQRICRIITTPNIKIALLRAGLEDVKQEFQTQEECNALTDEGQPVQIPSILTTGRKPRNLSDPLPSSTIPPSSQ